LLFGFRVKKSKVRGAHHTFKKVASTSVNLFLQKSKQVEVKAGKLRLKYEKKRFALAHYFTHSYVILAL